MRKFLLLLTFLIVPRILPAVVDPLRKVADDLANDLRRHPNKKIAVLDVPYNDNHFSEGPYLLSEKLANYLAKDRRLTILERNQISPMLGEMHLSASGVLDPKTAKKIGEVLGADVIVTGTLIDLDEGKTEINVRGLLVGNGRVIAASRGLLDRTWKSRPRLQW